MRGVTLTNPRLFNVGRALGGTRWFAAQSKVVDEMITYVRLQCQVCGARCFGTLEVCVALDWIEHMHAMHACRSMHAGAQPRLGCCAGQARPGARRAAPGARFRGANRRGSRQVRRFLWVLWVAARRPPAIGTCSQLDYLTACGLLSRAPWSEVSQHVLGGNPVIIWHAH